jgi:glutaconate CoA-transferase subunit B
LSGGTMRLEIIGSRSHNALTALGSMFDFACQGRYDGLILSPGQIDGAANINLVGAGEYPRLDVRWPGSHGTPLYYMMVPNVILFRNVHRRSALVPKVDFISAPGTSAPNVYRPGGPSALVTNMGYFSFDRELGRFRLESIHLGHSLQQIVESTGFSFDRGHAMGMTPLPDDETLDLIGGQISNEIADIYPQFAKLLPGSAEALRATLAARTMNTARSDSM